MFQGKLPVYLGIFLLLVCRFASADPPTYSFAYHIDGSDSASCAYAVMNGNTNAAVTSQDGMDEHDIVAKRVHNSGQAAKLCMLLSSDPSYQPSTPSLADGGWTPFEFFQSPGPDGDRRCSFKDGQYWTFQALGATCAVPAGGP